MGNCYSSSPKDVVPKDVVQKSKQQPIANGIHSSDHKDNEGETFLLDYQIERVLGKGGFGEVFLAIHKNTNTKVAIKVFHHTSAKDELKFDNEIQILHKVNGCKTCLNIHSVAKEPTRFFIVTEFLGGGELFDHIRRNFNFSEQKASKLFAQMANTIHYLHTHEIVHLDLKPENFVFDSDDKTLKLIDFGTAIDLNPPREYRIKIGTPFYVAPEMLKNPTKTASELKACDMWGLGVVLYVMTTGFLPFHGANRNEIFKAVMKGEFKFPPHSSLSPDLKNLIERLLDLDVNHRFTSYDLIQHPFIANPENFSDEPFGEFFVNGINHCWDDTLLKRELERYWQRILSQAIVRNINRCFTSWILIIVGNWNLMNLWRWYRNWDLIRMTYIQLLQNY